MSADCYLLLMIVIQFKLIQINLTNSNQQLFGTRPSYKSKANESLASRTATRLSASALLCAVS